ncbi:hypothetical protein P7K49_002454 [Saguinus oedipus]|uniref:Uncharacterized protein n=1 Tax=Saguinus oedipus TaxID=9490 RepID=A0ABQ9WHD6_SAGOE|nr:hypothetical protein P7K49_002454 [Saguinus oedipus]
MPGAGSSLRGDAANTHPFTRRRSSLAARATTPQDSPLARYLSRGHPSIWPLHFRDTTLRTELRRG